MSDSPRDKGVFFFQEPTEFALKSCSFYWKNIVVYESFISDLVGSPELTEMSKTLLENNIIKIVQTPEGLKNAMWDKIYTGLDEDLRYLLRDHPERFVISPEKPKDFDKIIEESTRIDEKNEDLKKIIDGIIQLNISQQWLDPLYSSSGVPEEYKKEMRTRINEIAEMQIAHYKKNQRQGGYGFESRNRILLEQVNASSAMLFEYNWTPYYQYKLGDRRYSEARKYLEGMKTIYPFLKKKTIDNYSIEEILKIRTNRRWNTAMEKMADICDNAKLHHSEDGFQKEIYDNVQTEIWNYFDETEVSYQDILKGTIKEGIFTAIGILSMSGNTFSSVAGFAEPIVEYLIQKKKQNSLPFFINDLRKI